MRNRFWPALFVAAAFLIGAFGIARATYNGGVVFDGTVMWFEQMNSTHQLTFQGGTYNSGSGPFATAFTLDPTGGFTLPNSTVGNLPTCSATLEGTFRVVTDANATTIDSTAAGSGTHVMPVMCDGTNWTIQ